MLGNIKPRRVVITGLGSITPFGVDTEVTWNNLITGRGAFGGIKSFDASPLKCQIAAEIESQDGAEFSVDIKKLLDNKEMRRGDRFIHLAQIASDIAIKDSGILEHIKDLAGDNQKLLERIGVMIGSGIGGLALIENTSCKIQENANKIKDGGSNPLLEDVFFIPKSLINLASGCVSIKYNFSGPNHSVVTACATGTHAIGDSAMLIALGNADVMVAGGTEAAICRISMAGFDVMRALSRNYNDRPNEASRPWDKDRDGFVMGEGSGVLILEELEHAKARNARIYAEILGYGLSGDAYHISAPHPEARGAVRSMQMALNMSNLDIKDIDYINAHGTSTPGGDLLELLGIKKLFENAGHADYSNVCISSTKSSIGHLLGAAGAVESIFSILSIYKSFVPPTRNLQNPEGLANEFDLVPHIGRSKNVNAVLKNSFGFGGTNASLVFGKYR